MSHKPTNYQTVFNQTSCPSDIIEKIKRQTKNLSSRPLSKIHKELLKYEHKQPNGKIEQRLYRGLALAWHI